jgi:hypothetical protein
VYEHGPWRINDTNPKQLYANPNAWAKQANVVYLESPAGVGFSYSSDTSDYRTNDDKTALLNAATMKVFFKSYPELIGNEFFITGESYGGVYVPTLAEAIMWEEGNKTWTGAKLTGIAVGNGCTGTELGVCGGERDKYMTQFLLGQAFVKKSLKDQINQYCDWTKPMTPKCGALLLQMSDTIGHVNMYDIYGPCISGSEEAIYGANHSKIGLGRWEYGGPDACINSISGSAYLNQPQVIDALHVEKQKFPWSVCGNQIDYTPNRPNLPRDTYPALIANMRVLIFNGDWDACVPYTDNEAWTEGMGLKVADDWHPWMYGGQVGGYATRYFGPNNFTFITIKGGRHEVPETAPEQSSEMLRRLLAHENF